MITLLLNSFFFSCSVCVCYTLMGKGGSICIICAVCGKKKKKSGTLFCKSTFKLPQ